MDLCEVETSEGLTLWSVCVFLAVSAPGGSQPRPEMSLNGLANVTRVTLCWHRTFLSVQAQAEGMVEPLFQV